MLHGMTGSIVVAEFIRIYEQTRRRKTMSTDPQAGRGPSSIGFTASTADDLGRHWDCLDSIHNRLNELGSRLIGPDQLPRNQRDKAREVAAASDAPEPVRSDTEKLTKQLQRVSVITDEIQEVVGFLEQL